MSKGRLELRPQFCLSRDLLEQPSPSHPRHVRINGAILWANLLAATAYFILVNAILAEEGPHSTLAIAVGKDVKGKLSIVAYLAAIPLAFVHQAISDAIYVSVALIWLIPDRRIESTLNRSPKG